MDLLIASAVIYCVFFVACVIYFAWVILKIDDYE